MKVNLVFDTEWRSTPICPHCGKPHLKWREVFYDDLMQDKNISEITCNECDERFSAVIHLQFNLICFTTLPIEAEKDARINC